MMILQSIHRTMMGIYIIMYGILYEWNNDIYRGDWYWVEMDIIYLSNK